jgi:hypothetical protein
MKNKKYLLTGILLIIISLIFLPSWLPVIFTGKSMWTDNDWFTSYGFLSLLVLGILYLLMAVNKLKINKLSNLSIKLLITGLTISIIGIPIIFLIIAITTVDSWFGLSGFILLFISGLLFVLSLILCVISLFKTEPKQKI